MHKHMNVMEAFIKWGGFVRDVECFKVYQKVDEMLEKQILSMFFQICPKTFEIVKSYSNLWFKL